VVMVAAAAISAMAGPEGHSRSNIPVSSLDSFQPNAEDEFGIT